MDNDKCLLTFMCLTAIPTYEITDVGFIDVLK